MLEIEKFLANHEMKTDELGRIVVEDLELLEKINGYMVGDAGFVLSDSVYASSNCVY